MTTWIFSARDALLRQRLPGGGWGYRPGGEAFVEPTALAGLALLASAPDAVSNRVVREAADWLAAIQRPDGALGLSAQTPTPCWPTPHAILFWAALGDYQAGRKRAAERLLESVGQTSPADPSGVIGHDSSIAGWPWVEGTHSWLEPTAMAVLALRREGYTGHARLGEGIRMICDRAIPGGAWNYGNRAMFGATLRPQSAPTGIALLALTGSDATTELIEGGCRYLRNTLPRVRAPRSLAWGLLGLEAWRQRPAEADAWLAESFARVEQDGPTSVDLAHFLLAASRRTLDLLGAGAFEGSAA